MSVIIDKIKTILRINKNVIEGEIDEIKSLKVTEEDEKQGEAVATLAVTACTSMGIPLGVVGQKILTKVFAYAIRDIKDGASSPNKLIIGRVIDEIKKEHNKNNSTQDALYENLNKK